MTFEIAKGAERPSVAYGFLVDDAAASLAGAGSVTFRMRSVAGTAWVVNRAGTVTSESGGSVRYDWASGDTATAGDYLGHFTVYFSDGELAGPEFPVRVFSLAPAGAAVREVRALLDDADAAYFSDLDVADALARHAHVLIDEPIAPAAAQTRGGTVQWRVYDAGYAWLDEGVALHTSDGSTVSGWSLDAGPGRVTFAASTGGSVYLLSGTAHEPALAAADLADRLAARYAREFDFESDGASFKRSQRAQSWAALAQRLRASAMRPSSAAIVRRDSAC